MPKELEIVLLNWRDFLVPELQRRGLTPNQAIEAGIYDQLSHEAADKAEEHRKKLQSVQQAELERAQKQLDKTKKKKAQK